MLIAVIGGIGSGKSEVMKLLAARGCRVCDCDDIYKEICESEDYIDKIGKVFGAVEDGKIDKSKLGRIVFADKAKLRILNSLAHPYIFDKIKEIEGEGNRLFVEVSAFEESMRSRFDIVVLVKSAKENRLRRVKLRSGYDDDFTLSIMANQISEEQAEKLADFVIVNDGDVRDLTAQVELLIERLIG